MQLYHIPSLHRNRLKNASRCYKMLHMSDLSSYHVVQCTHLFCWHIRSCCCNFTVFAIKAKLPILQRFHYMKDVSDSSPFFSCALDSVRPLCSNIIAMQPSVLTIVLHLSWCLHWDSSYLNMDTEWGVRAIEDATAAPLTWVIVLSATRSRLCSLSYKIKGHCFLSYKIKRVDLHSQVFNPTIGTWLQLTWHLGSAQNRQCSEVLIFGTSKLMITTREFRIAFFRMLLWAFSADLLLFSRMLPSVLTVALILPTTISAMMRIEVASPMSPVKEPMGSQFMLQVIWRWCPGNVGIAPTCAN